MTTARPTTTRTEYETTIRAVLAIADAMGDEATCPDVPAQEVATLRHWARALRTAVQGVTG